MPNATARRLFPPVRRCVASFYQYVQPFSPQERIALTEAYRIALELAERTNPNPSPMGNKFGLCRFGGSSWGDYF